MAEKLKIADPEAYRNIGGRMSKANCCGLWQPNEETLQELWALYDMADEELEGIKPETTEPKYVTLTPK